MFVEEARRQSGSSQDPPAQLRSKLMLAESVGRMESSSDSVGGFMGELCVVEV